MAPLDNQRDPMDKFNLRPGIFILLGLLGSLWLAGADEALPLLKVNGETYTNVTVTRVTATDIYFTSTNGMGNAKLKNLSHKLQKHFHYDAAKAKAAESQQAADAAQYIGASAGRIR
jgi:hypothetical protein